MECVSLIPLPTCLFPSPYIPPFSVLVLVDAMRAAYPFSLPLPLLSLSLSQPLRKFESAREKVNDPSGDFQRSGDWNHRWDSSRLNSPVCRWYKKTNRPILGYVPGEVAGCCAWFDPWKWLSGIEPSIDEDLMLIRCRSTGELIFFFFTFDSFRKYTYGWRGEGRGGSISFMPGEWKIGE